MALVRICTAILLLIGIISTLQVKAAELIPQLKYDSKILQESIVERVNSDATAGWKAAMNPRFSNFTVREFKYLLGVKAPQKGDLESTRILTHKKGLTLPNQFDARTAWPHCGTIGRILDQGHCGSCWAFGAVETLSDRFCIHFGMNISLSVNDLLACCGFMCGDGCDGGYPLSAWRYFVHSGVVTEECDPYFDNEGCSHPGCEPAYPTPKCYRKCVKGNLLWKQAKHYSKKAYKISSDPYDIMAEVFRNGPVQVSFTVYEDFAHYQSGVYKHITGSSLGGHSVKLIGWGTSEDGEDYWLLANQWNKSWGDEGYFMIKRGTNECGIEGSVVSGMPSPRNLIKELSSEDLPLESSS